MTLTDTLLSSGYVYDNIDWDDCYVKSDDSGFIHVFQKNIENEGEWNYVKMSEDYDILFEETFSDNIQYNIP